MCGGQRVQLVVGGCIHLDELQSAIRAEPVYAVQHQAVQVDVQVGGQDGAAQAAPFCLWGSLLLPSRTRRYAPKITEPRSCRTSSRK
jgi:hypothetical protein